MATLQPPLGKRQRSDSVLGNRMDDTVGYKRMRVGTEKWRKLAKVISKPDTQLCMIEVPKGVSNFRTV